MGDFDGDGDMDLYVANYGQANKLYLNSYGVTSITLVVKPVAANNGVSLFSSVTLSTLSKGAEVMAMQTLHGGSGFLSQNE